MIIVPFIVVCLLFVVCNDKTRTIIAKIAAAIIILGFVIICLEIKHNKYIVSFGLVHLCMFLYFEFVLKENIEVEKGLYTDDHLNNDAHRCDLHPDLCLRGRVHARL